MRPGTSYRNLLLQRNSYRIVSGTHLFRNLTTAALTALVLPLAAGAQISLVHVTACGPQNFPSSCTIPATGSGNLLVVGFQMGGGVSTAITLSKITDNAGNAWAEAGAARSIDAAAGSVADLWYAKNTAAGATSVTIGTSAPIANGAAVVWEFSGADPTVPLDQTAVLNSQPSTASPAAPAFTITAANEVILSLAAVSGNITGMAAGSAFTSDATLKGNGWARLIATTAGTYQARWVGNPAGTYAASAASFRARASQTTNSCDVNADGAVDIVDVQVAANMALGLQPCSIAGSNVCTATQVQQIRDAALGATCPIAPGPVSAKAFYSAMPPGKPPNSGGTLLAWGPNFAGVSRAGDLGFTTGPVVPPPPPPPATHSVTLNWTPSTSPGVSYHVYRSTTPGGPYTKLTAAGPVAAAGYKDTSVTAGQTYFYTTTAIDPATALESTRSNEASAAIPVP